MRDSRHAGAAAGQAPLREQLVDRRLSTDGCRQRQVVLDSVAVATAVLFLDDVAGVDQVVDDAERSALGIVAGARAI